MGRLKTETVWGLLLVAFGVLYLLRNFGYLGNSWNAIFPLLFAAAGAALLALFAINRSAWWALLPGFALLGLAGTTALDLASAGLTQAWGGPVFLGGLSLGFWSVYVVRRKLWWAIIPGGVLLTLAALAALPDQSGGQSSRVFFFGMALTFTLVYVLSRIRWAAYPAALLFVVGALLSIGIGPLVGYIWPIVLIAFGLFLVVRVLRSPPS